MARIPKSTKYQKQFTVYKKLKKLVIDIHIRLATTIIQSLAKETPVDTGRARYNWQFTFDMPADQAFIYTGDPAAATGLAIERALPEILQIKDFCTTYITNNVIYVIFLNYGTSTQAPAYYINDIVRRSVYAIKQVRTFNFAY